MAMFDTEGRRLLERFLKDSGRSQSWLAKLVGVTQPAVSGWLTGSSRPEPHLRLILENVCGIPASKWLTDEERSAVAAVDARLATGTG